MRGWLHPYGLSKGAPELLLVALFPSLGATVTLFMAPLPPGVGAPARPLPWRLGRVISFYTAGAREVEPRSHAIGQLSSATVGGQEAPPWSARSLASNLDLLFPDNFAQHARRNSAPVCVNARVCTPVMARTGKSAATGRLGAAYKFNKNNSLALKDFVERKTRHRRKDIGRTCDLGGLDSSMCDLRGT